MVDKNNAKEADQFNEAYLWTQSVLNKGNYKHVLWCCPIVLEAQLHR